MRIIREGNKAKLDPMFYFHCNRCDCEFEALKSECKYVDGYYACDSGYVYSCPTCGYWVWTDKCTHYEFLEPTDDSKVSPCIRNKCLNPSSCCGCDEYYKWKKESDAE